jgi:hypothetical protein
MIIFLYAPNHTSVILGAAMSIEDPLSRQIQAFHAAILDNCERAARAEQPDTMVLRLRINALALAKVQLAMVALVRVEPPEHIPATRGRPDQDPTGDRWDPASGPWPGESSVASTLDDEAPTADALREPPQRDDQDDRILTGDALSRFVSYRLTPDQSPHEVWQRMQETDPAKQRHKPALPRAGFRSPSR